MDMIRKYGMPVAAFAVGVWLEVVMGFGGKIVELIQVVTG